jgi:hypothetical protein
MIAVMRVSFDMDGVLADMDAALASIAKREFGISAPTGVGRQDVSDSRTPQPEPDVPLVGSGGTPTPADVLPMAAVLSSLTPRQQTRLWKRVTETPNFWETLDELEPGSIRRLYRLARELAWEVLFVTQRPPTAGRTAQRQSQRWLAKHGFEFPAVYTTRGSRGRIAGALTLDAHIDDRLDNALDIATDSPAWSILVWRDDPSFAKIQVNAKRMNIAVVRTVSEALDKLEHADRSVRHGSRGRAASDGPSGEGAAILERLKRAFGFRVPGDRV